MAGLDPAIHAIRAPLLTLRSSKGHLMSFAGEIATHLHLCRIALL